MTKVSNLMATIQLLKEYCSEMDDVTLTLHTVSKAADEGYSRALLIKTNMKRALQDLEGVRILHDEDTKDNFISMSNAASSVEKILAQHVLKDLVKFQPEEIKTAEDARE